MATLLKEIKGVPDPFASFEEKKTDEYGIKIGNFIGSEWFNGTTIATGCEFWNRRDYVIKKRLLVRGEQDTKPYKDHQARGDNDLNFLNLDWTPMNLVKKFCRLVSNGISDDKYRLDVHATDALSTRMKVEKQDEYRKNMAAKNMLQKAKDVLNIDLMPKGFVPEDEEELELFMEIKDRPKIEICEEILIDFVKQTNNWDYIHSQTNIDNVDIGLFGVQIYTDKTDGIKLRYIDPENYVHSRVTRNDFSDKYYEGYVDTITLSDLRREADFSENDLRTIAKAYSTRNKAKFGFDFDRCAMESIIDYKVDVLRFAWKTSKEIKFKGKVRKGELVKVSRKPDTYKAPERSDVKEISKKLDTWFEGNYIIGVNAIYGYKECENLARDTMNKALSPFVFMATDIYNNIPRSFLSDIEVPAKEMQNIHLKIQQLLAELKPDVIEIDLDMLAELDDGKGGVKSEVWQTALTLLQVKGVVFKKRIDMGDGGGIKEASAARTQAQSQGSAVAVLLNAWAFYYNIIRDISGVNPAADGTMRDDALVGVNQLAQLAYNTATKHIVDASINFNKKVCEVISTRLHGIFKHKEAEHLKQIYINAVGKHFIDAMEVLADRHLHEFGFYFRMLPTNQELAEFREDLTLSQQDGNLLPEVKAEALSMAKSNPKMARKYLFYHTRKRAKQRMEEQMILAKNKSENDSAAAQAKVGAELQSYAQKKQLDLQYEAAMAKIRNEEYQAQKMIDAPSEERKFQQEVYLAKIDEFSSLNKETFKEDRKDERTKLQATQQSKILDQRNKDGQPINFENEFSMEDLMQ